MVRLQVDFQEVFTHPLLPLELIRAEVNFQESMVESDSIAMTLKDRDYLISLDDADQLAVFLISLVTAIRDRKEAEEMERYNLNE